MYSHTLFTVFGIYPLRRKRGRKMRRRSERRSKRGYYLFRL
jgi:hypothetical protein